MKYIRWFSDISLADVASVGGKNASLGEMYRELAPPPGHREHDQIAVGDHAHWPEATFVLDQPPRSDRRRGGRA